MILEGIVTTLSKNGELNITPMGPHFEPGSTSFELRPFESSQTYQNLCQHSEGVLHITDDVLLFARSAINQLDEIPPTATAAKVQGRVIQNCCRYFEFRATEKPTVEPRKNFHCEILHAGKFRDFYGFNRAKHAVLEATILATRIQFLPIEEILDQFSRLRNTIEKTAGPDEQVAFEILKNYVNG